MDPILVSEAIVVVIIVVIVVVVSHIVATEDGVGEAVAPLSSLAVAALSLIPLLIVCRLIVPPSYITIIVLPSVSTPLPSVATSCP